MLRAAVIILATATAGGILYRFRPVDARYVRVTMLHNSANIGVHIAELAVHREAPPAHHGVSPANVLTLRSRSAGRTDFGPQRALLELRSRQPISLPRTLGPLEVLILRAAPG